MDVFAGGSAVVFNSSQEGENEGMKDFPVLPSSGETARGRAGAGVCAHPETRTRLVYECPEIQLMKSSALAGGAHEDHLPHAGVTGRCNGGIHRVPRLHHW